MISATPEEERARRLKQRNRAVLAVLLALVGLFYVITIVRMSEGEQRRQGRSPGEHGPATGSSTEPAGH